MRLKDNKVGCIKHWEESGRSWELGENKIKLHFISNNKTQKLVDVNEKNEIMKFLDKLMELKIYAE